MSFFSHKQKDTLNLIVDIQSSVVRGALILNTKGEPPHVIWTSDIDIPYRAHAGGEYLIDTTVKAVESISNSAHMFVKNAHLQDSSLKKISKIHCVLSSPWIVSQARTVSQSFEKEIKVNRAHLNSIIKNERSEMTRNADGYMVGIEEKIFDVRLNGYSITEWEGANAMSVEVSFAVSMASKKIIELFAEAFRKNGLHSSQVDFHSSLLLQHIGLSKIIPFNEPYILVHVHGELTDIVVANGHTCLLFGSHPIGIRTILRKLSSKLKTTQITADSALSVYEDTVLDPLHGVNDTKKIQNVLNEWVDNCLKVTALIPGQYKPVHAIISSRYHENIFKTTFSASYPSVKIESLTAEDLYELVTFDTKAERLRLVVLYLVAIHSLESL